jgi:hypothetical protein
MRLVVIIMCLGATVPAAAQDATPAPDVPKPAFVIGGNPPPHSRERCIEVEIGSSRSYSCINDQLKHEVDRVNPSLTVPPVDARSPDTRIGIGNVPAVQQQYGSNFGKSVVPFRPPAPTFDTPGVHR